jgi:hypothetical protein
LEGYFDQFNHSYHDPDETVGNEKEIALILPIDQSNGLYTNIVTQSLVDNTRYK